MCKAKVEGGFRCNSEANRAYQVAMNVLNDLSRENYTVDAEVRAYAYYEVAQLMAAKKPEDAEAFCQDLIRAEKVLFGKEPVGTLLYLRECADMYRDDVDAIATEAQKMKSERDPRTPIGFSIPTYSTYERAMLESSTDAVRGVLLRQCGAVANSSKDSVSFLPEYRSWVRSRQGADKVPGAAPAVHSD